MKWLEVITLRSLGKGNVQTVDELLSRVCESRPPGHSPQVKLYRHSIVETDLSIHICWDEKCRHPEPSSLAQQLSYSLKALGLHNYSLWVETAASE